MSNLAHERESVLSPCIVVAGDVCIDWLSIPVDSLVQGQDLSQPMNWQLRGGRHMYARRGGAWLTADFVEAAIGNTARVVKPELEPNLENVPPEKIIHSMLMLDSRDRERKREKVPHWVVTHFEGYAGPAYPIKPKVKSVEGDDKNAQIVLLDDAGNGFRDSESAWPLALSAGCIPLVLYKVRRPLGKGALWERLKASHLERTIALLGADELRVEGGSINRGLSWERTATDLILSLAQEPRFASLRSCPFIIVTLGLEGVVLVRLIDKQVSRSHLWYLPDRTEGESIRMKRGDMSGFGSAFAATITSALVESCNQTQEIEKLDKPLQTGIRCGLTVMHNLLEEGFGPCILQDELFSKRRPPGYPIKEIFHENGVKEGFPRPIGDMPVVSDVRLPDPPRPSSEGTFDFRSWRILESKRDKVYFDLAAEVTRRGPEKVFKDVPIGKFGKLITLERSEIESYRSIRNLITGFLDTPRPKRPLCLAVFGAPGSGKSFGVTQVARSLETEEKIEELSFNVSQWNSPDYLVNALHRVRDHAIQGKVPLVFFDEFDSRYGSQSFGWLKYFLAPMQDGIFADGLFTHDIGKAIFVFAGGTANTFAEFERKPTRGSNRTEAPNKFVDRIAANPESVSKQGSNSVEQAGHGAALESQHSKSAKDSAAQISPGDYSSEKFDSKSVKLPDFVSRLRGHVDIFGFDPPVGTNILRRALVLRSNLLAKFPRLKDGSDALRIDDGVLRGFLQVPEYYHGARSLEAILDMSQLVGRSHFDPSLLPPLHQLNMHVDGNAFMALVKVDEIALEIHELYLSEELAKMDSQGNTQKIGARPALEHWENLDDLYKKSNREQAASYPTLLAAAGCSLKEGNPDPDFKFSQVEIEGLAKMEHERWMQERRIKQPDHPCLVPWSELPQEEKDKDIRTIKAIPKILGRAGLRVVRLL